jgi:hypothetical protein
MNHEVMSMNKIIFALLAVSLMGCSTPRTVLKNPDTDQVATCGGDYSAGGVEYHVEKAQAKTCVDIYRSQGFEIVE